MDKIKLTKNKVTLVDDEDFEYLNSFKWYICNKGYVVRLDPYENRRQIRLHRVVVDNPTGQSVDHINRDKLDNRKSNLRVVTDWQNRVNRIKYKNNQSGYKGVYFRSNRNHWCALMNFKGKEIYLGSFENPEKAAMAYNEAAKKYHGEYANFNRVGGYNG